MDESRKGRGGRRPGAGRPKENSRTYSFRAPEEMARRIDALPGRTEFIRRSIEHELRAMDSAAEKTAAAIPDGMGQVIPASRVKPLHVPYFDVRVVAGFPIPLDNDERSQDIDMLRLLCPHPEASYLIRVDGDSMTDAGVMSGDIVIVDKSRRDPGPHEIAVCELNGEYTLKHFIEDGGQGWLVPANPAYPRIPVTEDDDFSIWGTVTYIIHKARD